MEKKLNCWEFMKCGRMLKGCNVRHLGICPVITATEHDGKNSGKNGGRICWQVAGSFCGGKVQGTYAEKQSSCLKCEFAKYVFDEEGKDLQFL